MKLPDFTVEYLTVSCRTLCRKEMDGNRVTVKGTCAGSKPARKLLCHSLRFISWKPKEKKQREERNTNVLREEGKD